MYSIISFDVKSSSKQIIELICFCPVDEDFFFVIIDFK